MVLKSRKIVSMLIIFVMVFSYMGQTLKAIASTDGITTITNGFFGSPDIVLNSYFEENENQNNEKVTDVNEKANLILEVSPKNEGKGFIREGAITANSLDENDINFKFSKIADIIVENDEKEVKQEEQENEVENQETDDSFIHLDMEKENVEDNEQNEEQEEQQEKIQDENANENESEQIEEDDEDKLVDEEQVIQDVLKEENEEDDGLDKFQVELTSDNEISLKNVIDKTKIVVEIEYLPKEEVKLSDLYQEIELKLDGKYIDLDLNEKEESVQSNITVGWSYHNDIEISSEYTKFSPYQVGERQGSILENKITVKREVENEEENYLPLKNTDIEIVVPTLNGELPESVSVVANKLMASKGQDTGNIEFAENDWEYQKEDGKVFIHVSNENEEKAINTVGTDEYMVVYRYANFVEEGNYVFDKNVIVNAEEYSANENNTISKNILESQEIIAIIGDMISYNVTTNEEPINKGKINANYNQENAMYETEFTTTVNLNILTSETFEELEIDSSRESYLDSIQTEFETNDVYYKKVKFNYNEINSLLTNGGTIEIYNHNRELLSTLNADNVTAQENCEVELNNPNGVYIVLKNVSVNQNLNIEYTKAIGKSNYDKATFNSFREIESKVQASVKYADDENRYSLSEVTTKKAMKSSMTKANMVLSNNNLSTTSENQNVEMKIELNNDTIDSDLYTNPSFEIVFPKYVKNVTAENVSLTYAGGLSIADAYTYTENDSIKMRIDLAGTQTAFSESTLTHGTNILLNLNITLDEYAPSKKDQIKMYYCNEAVTNYQSQTKWTIGKEIPEGIVRETNGFEVAVVNFVAPNGLFLSNAIVNYDGQQSVVKSLRQGTQTVKIAMESAPRIATMQLYVANNTGIEASQVVLLGRTPFANNTDVMTGDNLGTTVNANMFSGIVQNDENKNSATVYYSNNPNATADLTDDNNGWTDSPDTLLDVKTYMIVVNDSLAVGEVLKYSYDFEVPANLDYEAAIYGSFGAYYDYYFEEATISETSTADKVGLKTEIGIPIRMELKSDIAKNVGVGEGRFINYTLTVTSETADTLHQINLTNAIPEGTTLYGKSANSFEGDNGFVPKNIQELNWTIEELKPNDVYTQEYTVKVNAGMADQNVTNIVYASMEDMSQKSNIEETKVIKSAFRIEASQSATDEISVGDIVNYQVSVTNITGGDQKNVKLRYVNPEELEVTAIKDDNKEYEYESNKSTLENVLVIPELKENETKTFYISQIAKKANQVGVTSKISFETESGMTETSSELNFKILSANIELSQSADMEENKIEAGSEINLTLTINNTGKVDVTDLVVQNHISEFLEPVMIAVIGENSSSFDACEGNEIETELTSYAGESMQVIITANVKEDVVGKTIKNSWRVFAENTEDLTTDEMLIKVVEPVNDDEEDTEEIEETDETNETTTEGYSISGKTWVDSNHNGIKDEEDLKGVRAQVQLLKNGNVVKEMNTSSSGSYSFKGLLEGEYTVVTNYDSEMYKATTYAADIMNDTNSNVYETENGTAITDNIMLNNANIENLDIGLVEKEKFDFEIAQSIVKATVIVDGEATEYEYDNLDLAKLALNSEQLKNAIVKFEYKIQVTNVGNIDGKVSNIVDYLPTGMVFTQKDNAFWAYGTDGNLYYSGLKNTTIKAGETREISLVLAKQLTEVDNTGILSNKAQIVETESVAGIMEAKANNFASQETVITTSNKIGKIIIGVEITLIASVAIFGYMIKTRRIDQKKWIKKFYK